MLIDGLIKELPLYAIIDNNCPEKSYKEIPIFSYEEFSEKNKEKVVYIIVAAGNAYKSIVDTLVENHEE